MITAKRFIETNQNYIRSNLLYQQFSYIMLPSLYFLIISKYIIFFRVFFLVLHFVFLQIFLPFFRNSSKFYSACLKFQFPGFSAIKIFSNVMTVFQCLIVVVLSHTKDQMYKWGCLVSGEDGDTAGGVQAGGHREVLQPRRALRLHSGAGSARQSPHPVRQ